MKNMSAELMLESAEPSLLIVEERTRRDIVIGVPHHAPAGIPQLPCPTHKDADENAGFLGRYLAESLDCCSIIACNYRVDVNKYFRSDYTMQIAEWNPKVLVEIHGHGGKRAKYDVEISSGSAENDRFSVQMAQQLGGFKHLKSFSICGKYSEIYYKASDSVTISDGRWIAYHIELPSALRKPSDGRTGKPPKIGYAFCDALAEILKKMHEQ
jgi:hypothetical protein